MSKKVLMVLGVVIVLMGIAGLVPAWTAAQEPTWHVIVKIAVGLIAIYVAATDKKA